MKKQWNLIAPVALVILAALILAGWRTWGPHKSAGGWPELDGGVYAEAVTSNGLKYLVPPNEIYASGLSAEDRPALTNPKMVDIATADVKLADDLEGIAVTVGDQQRFYPFQILNWHEIVHDQVNGVDLAITYSPLTGSAVVYDDSRHFSDAGQVYNNALLMKAEGDDSTLWNQTTGQAIVGDVSALRLRIYPSRVMSWITWKDLHPDGLAMSTDTGYNRDYGRHPYASYETSKVVFFPFNHVIAALPPKDLVYRVDLGTEASVVFMGRYMPAQADVNEEIAADQAKYFIAGFYDEKNDTVRVYSRMPEDHIIPGTEVLTFEQKGGVITDKETGSRWSAEGVAISGPYKGEELFELPVTRHYAFAHFAMYPNSVISGEELLPTAEVKPEGIDLQIE